MRVGFTKFGLRAERFVHCLALLVSLTIALDAWLTLGLLVQGTLVAAAVLRRLRGHSDGVPVRTAD